MAANKVYRGPNDRQPKTVSNKVVTGALLPCTFVTEGAAALAQATAAGPMLRLLSNRDFYSAPGAEFSAADPLFAPYISGETGVAYVLEPGQIYQAALAAATYAYGQELTVTAAGRRTAALAGNPVVAFFKGVPGNFAAGTLSDVEIANFYNKA